MKLSVLNRLNLARLFPQEGGILQQLAIKDIAKKIEFSPEEIKNIGLKQVGNNITWNPTKTGLEIEITFSESELSILKQQVEKMDKEEKITQDMLDLCLMVRNEK